MKLWIYFIAVSVALPLLHGAALNASFGGKMGSAQLSVFLFFEGTIWVSSVAMFLMDAYRTRLLAGSTPERGTLVTTIVKMTLAGLLTPLVTLLISPLPLDEIGIIAAILLAITGLLFGACAGWLYWWLTGGDQA